jgi:hypothetical protein
MKTTHKNNNKKKKVIFHHHTKVSLTIAILNKLSLKSNKCFVYKVDEMSKDHMSLASLGSSFLENALLLSIYSLLWSINMKVCEVFFVREGLEWIGLD